MWIIPGVAGFHRIDGRQLCAEHQGVDIALGFCEYTVNRVGARIEDDVVVTRSGHEVITRQVPKSIEDIEALMAG